MKKEKSATEPTQTLTLEVPHKLALLLAACAAWTETTPQEYLLAALTSTLQCDTENIRVEI
jgi:hypothetical protein